MDEGVEQAFENMVKHGNVNTLLLSTHIDFQSTKAWGPLPHATVEHFDCDGFNGDICLDFYKSTQIKPVKTVIPVLNKRDMLDEIIRAAKKFNVKIYALILHRFPGVDRYQKLHMQAVNGEKIPKTLCHNQKDVRKFYKCLINHLDNRYELDGFCFALLDHYSLFGFQTLTDELADTLGIKRFSNPEMGLSCFCSICVQEAKADGLDVDGIRAGLLKGIEMGHIPHGVEKMKTADEAFRFLLNVPQYLQWLKFRKEIMVRLHKELFEYIKGKKDTYLVGLDIYGAKDDWKYQTQFQELAQYCDWIKPMFYSCTYEEPLSPTEIGEGVKLAKELSGKPIYPGINCLSSEPTEKIQQGIYYSLNHGAEGVILSWDYALTPFKHMQTAKNELIRQGVI